MELALRKAGFLYKALSPKLETGLFKLSGRRLNFKQAAQAVESGVAKVRHRAYVFEGCYG